MKTKLLILLIFTLNTNIYSIGFPHGIAKKKKVEVEMNEKKASKFEKKLLIVGNTMTLLLKKYFQEK